MIPGTATSETLTDLIDPARARAEAEADGTVVNLRNQVGIDPNADPDTAVLAMLLAA